MSILLLPLIFGVAEAAIASSTLSNDDGRHTAARAVDGLLSTGWAEGADGSGEGQWLTMDLGRRTEVEGISLWPGNLAKGARSYRENSRPRLIQVHLDGKPVGNPIRLLDEVQRKDIRIGQTGRRIKIEVLESYEGMVFQDLFIAELAVNYPAPDPWGRLDRWLATGEAKRAYQVFNGKIEAAYLQHRDAEFGDDEAFGMLTDAAAEGPAFLRTRARNHVPEGYRAQAIRSSAKAQEALRKLKDPNAIPALEMAALRSTGPDRQRLAEVVEIFYAYRDLIGGPSVNINYWGETGWGPGQLQSFGEPLAIEIDQHASIFLADTGNNRVQRFSDEGRAERQWGPEPDITNAWFKEGRPWYVSGSAAGDEAGTWWNPVDVEIIPGKEADGFAILDAHGKVGVFDETGNPIISWRVETTNAAEPRVGGQAFLGWIPKKKALLAVIHDEGVVFNLNAEEIGRFEIPDGAPNAMEVLPSGKVLMVFGSEVIQYTWDGFRHGKIMDRNLLGEGFEDLDLTIDEKGKLWAINERGWVYKFKKPGKLEFRIKAVERPLRRPRLAVREGIVFYVSDDVIEQVDVLQVKMDQEAADAAGDDDLMDGL
jgi:hypothetical protein